MPILTVPISGVTIGCGRNAITLTSAQAVTDFLPQGGGPLVLSDSYLNPTDPLISTLAGNLLAVQLALDFDAYDPNFGTSSGYLGDVINRVISGLDRFWAVALANDALGGCNTTYSLSAINDALSAISNNFVDEPQTKVFGLSMIALNYANYEKAGVVRAFFVLFLISFVELSRNCLNFVIQLLIIN